MTLNNSVFIKELLHFQSLPWQNYDPEMSQQCHVVLPKFWNLQLVIHIYTIHEAYILVINDYHINILKKIWLKQPICSLLCRKPLF